MSSLLESHISSRTDLVDLLNRPLEQHLRDIRERHPDPSAILTGDCPVVLYPAARMGAKAAALLRARGANVIAFSDKNPEKWGTTIDGLPVVPPASLAELPFSPAILLASTLHDSSMREYLESLGCETIYSTPFLNHSFPDIFVSREYHNATEAPLHPQAGEAILHLFDSLEDEESRYVLTQKIRYYFSLDKALLDTIRSKQSIYFDAEIVPQRDDHIVVDGGAFDGDTLRQFRALTSNQFTKYHAFEPDPIAFQKLQEEANNDARIEVNCAGLSKETGKLRFLATGTADGTIASSESETALEIDAIGLDAYFMHRQAPTFIKMDVEGSELDALRGARELIAAHEPVLAISAYHHPADLWEIPMLLLRLAPKSRIYLRHYTREIDDTVCYAVPA